MQISRYHNCFTCYIKRWHETLFARFSHFLELSTDCGNFIIPPFHLLPAHVSLFGQISELNLVSSISWQLNIFWRFLHHILYRGKIILALSLHSAYFNILQPMIIIAKIKLSNVPHLTRIFFYRSANTLEKSADIKPWKLATTNVINGAFTWIVKIRVIGNFKRNSHYLKTIWSNYEKVS